MKVDKVVKRKVKINGKVAGDGIKLSYFVLLSYFYIISKSVIMVKIIN